MTMSKTRTFELCNPEWQDVARDALRDALMSRYKALRDQFEQEAEGYSDNRKQWRSQSGESIDAIRLKYPYPAYEIGGEDRYWMGYFFRAYDTICQADEEIKGRDGTCTVEGVSDPASIRIRIELEDGSRVTIGLCRAKPYSLPRIFHRYKPAEQANRV